VTVRDGPVARSGGRKSTNRPLGLPSRCYGAGPGEYSTQRRDFVADSLQMARGAIDDAIRDCSTGQLRVKPHRLSGSPGPVGGVER